MQLKNDRFLLDASAVLALLKKETGASIVRSVFDRSAISAVNFSEVVVSLAKDGISEHDIHNMLFGLFPDVIPFSRHLAMLAGMMILNTKPYGLSFADRACIVTGISYGMQIYTADKVWEKLSIDGLKIVLIR